MICFVQVSHGLFNGSRYSLGLLMDWILFIIIWRIYQGVLHGDKKSSNIHWMRSRKLGFFSCEITLYNTCKPLSSHQFIVIEKHTNEFLLIDYACIRLLWIFCLLMWRLNNAFYMNKKRKWCAWILKSLIHEVTLNDHNDRWYWDVGDARNYMVKDTCHVIDEVLLDIENSATGWNQYVLRNG